MCETSDEFGSKWADTLSTWPKHPCADFSLKVGVVIIIVICIPVSLLDPLRSFPLCEGLSSSSAKDIQGVKEGYWLAAIRLHSRQRIFIYCSRFSGRLSIAKQFLSKPRLSCSFLFPPRNPKVSRLTLFWDYKFRLEFRRFRRSQNKILFFFLDIRVRHQTRQWEINLWKIRFNQKIRTIALFSCA